LLSYCSTYALLPSRVSELSAALHVGKSFGGCGVYGVDGVLRLLHDGVGLRRRDRRLNHVLLNRLGCGLDDVMMNRLSRRAVVRRAGRLVDRMALNTVNRPVHRLRSLVHQSGGSRVGASNCVGDLNNRVVLNRLLDSIDEIS
jgi:hypothetical protein